MLKNPPAPFERATGVNEKTYQCMAKGCGWYFRSANAEEHDCPHCGSPNTRDIAAVVEPGAASQRRNVS